MRACVHKFRPGCLVFEAHPVAAPRLARVARIARQVERTILDQVPSVRPVPDRVFDGRRDYREILHVCKYVVPVIVLHLVKAADVGTMLFYKPHKTCLAVIPASTAVAGADIVRHDHRLHRHIRRCERDFRICMPRERKLDRGPVPEIKRTASEFPAARDVERRTGVDDYGTSAGNGVPCKRQGCPAIRLQSALERNRRIEHDLAAARCLDERAAAGDFGVNRNGPRRSCRVLGIYDESGVVRRKIDSRATSSRPDGQVAVYRMHPHDRSVIAEDTPARSAVAERKSAAADMPVDCSCGLGVRETCRVRPCKFYDPRLDRPEHFLVSISGPYLPA